MKFYNWQCVKTHKLILNVVLVALVLVSANVAIAATTNCNLTGVSVTYNTLYEKEVGCEGIRKAQKILDGYDYGSVDLRFVTEWSGHAKKIKLSDGEYGGFYYKDLGFGELVSINKISKLPKSGFMLDWAIPDNEAYMHSLYVSLATHEALHGYLHNLTSEKIMYTEAWHEYIANAGALITMNPDHREMLFDRWNVTRITNTSTGLLINIFIRPLGLKIMDIRYLSYFHFNFTDELFFDIINGDFIEPIPHDIRRLPKEARNLMGYE